MLLENQLTNEEIKKEFDNPFRLVNTAIRIAKNHQKTGDDELPSLTEVLNETLVRADEFKEA